jgi:hypothetical protein
MSQKTIQRILALCSMAFIMAIAAWAHDSSGLAGKWNMTSQTSGDPVTWTLVLKDTDGKLSALLATAEGEMPAKDFTFQDGVLKFKAPYDGQDYEIQLKASGSKLDGTWSGGGDSGETHGTKAP